MQQADKVPGGQQLKLFYHISHMVTCFFEPVLRSILPLAHTGEYLLEFPFSCSVKLLDHFMVGEVFNFFSDPSFGCKSNKEYSTRDQADTRTSHFKDFREEGMYDLIFDMAIIELPSHVSLTEQVDMPVSDSHVDFFSFWMLHNPKGPIHEDVAPIIPLVVSKSFIACIHIAGEALANLEDENIQETVHDNLVCVDKYLWSHPSLLQKRLIFFTVKTGPGEWLGYVAVNPCVRLVEYAEELDKKYPTRFKTDEEVEDHLSGLLFNHSGHKQPKMTDTVCFRGF
jgi:hypothetical protein